MFVVRLGASAPQFVSRYVGEYRNEGFGKVVYNPSFLDTAGENGKARCRLCGVNDADVERVADIRPLKDTPLLRYIAQRRAEDEAEKYIFEAVNRFVETYKNRFTDKPFASQWGTIRSIAMQCATYNEIVCKLFEKTMKKGKDIKPDAYLTHGVAAERWKKKRRKDILREQFVDKIHSPENVEKYGDLTARALVNLASEMAKHAK